MREKTAASGPPPRLLVLAAGKGGVGVTTLAVNLAIGLAEQGARVVVVDADLHRNDVAAICGIPQPETTANAMVARRDIHEALQRGPAGIQIVPGLWAPDERDDGNMLTQDRILRQFRMLGPHADVLVLDVGTGPATIVRRFLAAADDILVITTPDSVSVMDTYSRIKSSLAGIGKSDLKLVVNRCMEEAESSDVHQRIDQSCRRFLGFGIALLGVVPEDDRARQATGDSVPFMIAAPGCPAARAVQRLAATLWNSPTEKLTRSA